MLTLGEVLALSRRSAGALELARLPEALMAAVQAEAAAEGLAPQDYLRVAVADFADFGAPEDWTHLMSRIRDEPDAGRMCLQVMLEWRIRASREARGVPATEPPS